MREKKVLGRKRHIAVDTQGNLLHVVVHPADWQDRDGIWHVLDGLDAHCPSVRHLWVDGGYRGLELDIHGAYGITVDVVKKHPDQDGFRALPRRWVVERTLAWINRARMLSKEYTRSEAYSESYIAITEMHRMLKKRAPLPELQQSYRNRQHDRKGQPCAL